MSKPRFKSAMEYPWGAGAASFCFSERETAKLRKLLGTDDENIIEAIEFLLGEYRAKDHGPTLAEQKAQLEGVERLVSSLRKRLEQLHPAIIDRLLRAGVDVADFEHPALAKWHKARVGAGVTGIEQLKTLEQATKQASREIPRRRGRVPTHERDVAFARALLQLCRKWSLNLPVSRSRDCAFGKLLAFCLGAADRSVSDVRKIVAELL